MGLGRTALFFGYFTQCHIIGLGRTAWFLGHFTKRICIFFWCGSNLESADFLLFQGHVNLLHVFLRRHWKWWVVFKTYCSKYYLTLWFWHNNPKCVFSLLSPMFQLCLMFWTCHDKSLSHTRSLMCDTAHDTWLRERHIFTTRSQGEHW